MLRKRIVCVRIILFVILMSPIYTQTIYSWSKSQRQCSVVFVLKYCDIQTTVLLCPDGTFNGVNLRFVTTARENDGTPYRYIQETYVVADVTLSSPIETGDFLPEIKENTDKQINYYQMCVTTEMSRHLPRKKLGLASSTGDPRRFEPGILRIGFRSSKHVRDQQ